MRVSRLAAILEKWDTHVPFILKEIKNFNFIKEQKIKCLYNNRKNINEKMTQKYLSHKLSPGIVILDDYRLEKLAKKSDLITRNL